MKRLEGGTIKKVYDIEAYLTELLFTFFFRDILYVILPLIVILFTHYIFGTLNAEAFLSSSDLAFAVTVLNAMALSSFIELKVKHQNPNSWSLFEGSKLYILLVVVSTLLLSFIILNEIGVFSEKINDKLICRLNVTLFIISASALFIKSSTLLAKKHRTTQKNNAQKAISETLNTIDYFNSNLKELVYLIETSNKIEVEDIPTHPKKTEICKKHEIDNLRFKIQQNKEYLDLIETKVTELYN